MPMRQTIGILLACLMISTGAIADSTESAGGAADAYLGPVYTIGKSEIGRAAWYNWVGSRTASGEILDWVTPTAAHRSLPLASYARVTNLDTGRAVVVKINDRGPYRRRFIIDLSPRYTLYEQNRPDALLTYHCGFNCAKLRVNRAIKSRLFKE